MTEPGWWTQNRPDGAPRPPAGPPGQAPPGQAQAYPPRPGQAPTQPIPQYPTRPIGPPGHFGPLQDLAGDPRGRGPQRPRRRGRGWIALVVVLVCFALLAVAADRVALVAAERALGRGVQAEQRLAAPAEVSIAGFPFLTQALAGRYRQIDLSADAVPAGAGLTVDRVTIRLTDVTAAASDVVGGRADRLRAGGVTVRARVGYRALDAAVADQLGARGLAIRFSDGGRNRLAITGTVRTPVGDLQVKGLVAASLVQRGVRLRLVPGSVAGLPAVADRLLADLLDLTLDAPKQLSGIRPTGVEVGPDGVTLTGTGRDVPLGDLTR